MDLKVQVDSLTNTLAIVLKRLTKLEATQRQSDGEGK